MKAQIAFVSGRWQCIARPRCDAIASIITSLVEPSDERNSADMGSPDKHLAKVAGELQPGERILAHVAGTITTTPTATSGTVRGILVLTDRRFVFSGTAWGAKGSRSVPLQQVTSIDLHKNLMTAHVQVTLAGGFERYMVRYTDAEPFARIAHDALAAAHLPASAAAVSTADEIAKYAALHAQGVLSDAEFAAAKARLLA